MAEAIYVRLRADVVTYVRELADESGESLAFTIETLLDEARRRRWRINGRSVQEPAA